MVEAPAEIVQVAFPIPLFLGELVVFLDQSKPVLIARGTERVEGSLFDERAFGIGHHTGGTQVILMIIADAQGGLWNLQFSRSAGDHEDCFTGGKELRKPGIGAGESRRTGLPTLDRSVVVPERDVRTWTRQGENFQPCAGLE